MLQDTDITAIAGNDAVQLVADALAGLDPEQPVHWPAFRALQPHLFALWEASPHLDRASLEPLVVSTALTARACNLSGAVADSERLMRAALAAAPVERDDPIRLAILQELAWPVASQGKAVAAQVIYRDVLAVRWRTLGIDHPDTLRTRHELAWIAAAQGRFVEAESDYREVLNARRRILGLDHPDTLITWHELGWVLAHHRPGQAGQILHEVYQARQRVLGERHPRTLKTRHDLVWVAARRGEWTEAEHGYRDLVVEGGRILGTDHPALLTFRHELAWVLAARGARRAARREYKSVLAARRELLGDDHPDTVATRHSLDRLRQGEVVAASHLV